MERPTHIADPLVVSRACALLEEDMRAAGFAVRIDGDFEAFSAARRQVRGGREAPLFDPAVTSLPASRAFWMAVENGRGEICGLQAFRLDYADPTLGEWALGWVLGIYLKRNELIIPDAVRPAETSVSHRISGPVVYHGELWIDRRVRNRRLVEWFSRLGMLLSLIKWHPTALWALIGNAMATRGHMIRMGYAHMEPGFMRWQFLPEGADPNEWLGLADAFSLQRLAEEIVLEHRAGTERTTTPEHGATSTATAPTARKTG
jgi:hypothetical protein